MFFAFSVSPKQRVKKPLPQVPVEEIPELKLAPFAANPKIFFEDVRIGQSVTKKLLIKNPMSFTYKLTVTKVPPADRGVVMSWVETEVEADSNVLLELTWTPREEGSWRDVLTMVDSRHVKRDVAVVFKTVAKKAKKRTGGVKAFKSPIKRFRSPKKKRSPIKMPSASPPVPDSKLTFILESDKENSPAPVSGRDNTYTLPPCLQLTTPRRKNTYLLQPGQRISPRHSPLTERNALGLSFAEKLNGSGFVSPRNASFRGEAIPDTPIRRETYDVHPQPGLPEPVDSFNDSLELDRSCDSSVDGLLRKLQSDSFAFTPLPKDPRALGALGASAHDGSQASTPFNPTNCSTELKLSCQSRESSVSEHGSNPRALFGADHTYELSPTEPNLSAGTFPHNVSGGTFTMGNLSSSTCILLSPEFKQASSPVPAAQAEPTSAHALNFSGVNARAALSRISEEDVEPNTSVATKRKSSQRLETVFAVSPPKRAFVARRSPAHRKKPAKRLPTLRLAPTISTGDSFLVATMYPAASAVDPFIASSLFLDDQWLARQTHELKKWLNALLTPPSELDTSAQSRRVDVARLWQECTQRELAYAPSRDTVSARYHTSRRLDGLRRAARVLFHSVDVRTVLSRVTLAVENKLLAIRDNRHLHLDVGLQSHVMQLLLCYNPLWLRLGLETVYGETIPLDSNSDVLGLSTFIVLRLFRDPYLMPRAKPSSLYLPTYATCVKRSTLKRFLALVYFLDRAKTSKLIAHDPCLFCRDAPLKDSRALLLSFARELLAAVGDVTKFLGRLGYVVRHRQSYLDEFDYAVRSLGTDLRDGIRLTRVMEVILEAPGLTDRLRAPPISRLQKVHNVKVALDSLQEAGHTIAGDIRPKDIVDGHREKTLSLLWQIVYQFQAPRFTRAALRIQHWWRSLTVVVTRRVRYKPYLRRVRAAVTIQRAYRARKLTLAARTEFLRLRQAAVTIQRRTRSMFLARRDRLQYLVTRQAVLVVQQKYRATKLMRQQRQDYTRLKQAVVMVQQHFRARCVMRQTREFYVRLRATVVHVQRIFRARRVGRADRAAFVRKRNAAVVVQRFFRGAVETRAERARYVQRRQACLTLQRHLRATLTMRTIRRDFLELRRTVVWVQNRVRSIRTMNQDKSRFERQKQAVILIQRYFRAIILGRQHRQQYLVLKQTVVLVQHRFRATAAAKKCRQRYLSLRNSAVALQQRFRANKEMRRVRTLYLQRKSAVLVLQQRFRARLAMRKCRQEYLQLTRIVLVVQRRFRAKRSMRVCRAVYLQQKNAVVVVQQRFRARSAMKQAREAYLRQRRAAVTIQQRFKAHLAMNQGRQAYLQQRQAVVIIQQRFRAHLAMRQGRQAYLQQRRASVVVQRWYRSITLTRAIRTSYLQLKRAVVTVQCQHRANRAMKHDRQAYLAQRRAIIIVQRRFRANLAMKQSRENYRKQKQAAVRVQQRFRANLAMKQDRRHYLKQKQAALRIQQRFRANMAMKRAREEFLRGRQAVITVQNWFRAARTMKQYRATYLLQKQAAVTIQLRFRSLSARKHAVEAYAKQRRAIVWIQQRFRATQATKAARTAYLQQRHAILTIQTWFRRTRIMIRVRTAYRAQRQAVVIIQQRFRALVLMKQARQNYLKQRQAAIVLQQRFRAHLRMQRTRNDFLRQRQATVVLQQRFRANVAMKQTRAEYLAYVRAAVVLQRRFRANVAMKHTRRAFLNLRTGVVSAQRSFRRKLVADSEKQQRLLESESAKRIQRFFRGYLQTKLQRKAWLKTRESAVLIQKHIRSYLAMKATRDSFVRTRGAVIRIQRWYRGCVVVRKLRTEFLLQKHGAIRIQRWFRGNLYRRRTEENNRRDRAAIVIQSWSRMLAAKRLLSALRDQAVETEERRKFQKTVAAVIKIQAVWRGYRARCLESEKLTRIRQRTIEANKRALPEHTAGERNREAIEILTYDYHISMKDIIRALTVLDFTTRLLPQACIELRDKIAERLYLVLASTNRSVPDMDACVLATSVLINLLKFKPTSAAVWKPHFLDTLLHMTLHWSSHEGLLFPYICTLLWLFAQNPEHAKAILKEENAGKILLKAHQECQRKQKMLSRIKSAPANTIQKQHIGARIAAKHNGDKSFVLTKTNTPSLNPDWGILNSKHPRTFVNPTYAIKCLLRKLNIPVNQ